MADIRLEKGVKRVTVVGETASGATVTVVRERKKKRQSKGLRGIEKLVRRSAGAYVAYADTYLVRHERSNRRRRDGWLRDLGVNLWRAQREGWKKLDLRKLFGL